MSGCRFVFGRYVFGRYVFGRYVFGIYVFGRYVFGRYVFELGSNLQMKNLLTNYDQKNVKIESMKHVLINKYIDAKFEEKVTEICPFWALVAVDLFLEDMFLNFDQTYK